MSKGIKIIVILFPVAFLGLFLGSLFFKKTIKQNSYETESFVLSKNNQKKEILLKKDESGIVINSDLKYCNIFPKKRKNYFPTLKEKAGIAILFDQHGRAKELYKKNIKKKLPIASLTKMMTAMVVVDNYDLNKIVKISKKAVSTPEETGRLSPGEKISIRGLLKLALMVSSNDAASALSEIMGEKIFLDLMNKKAKEIGMVNTHFENPHGLDGKNHYSTAEDLALMTHYCLVNYPEIWRILEKKQDIIKGYDHLGGVVTHWPNNTNKLLGEKYVLGGKTGYTDKAGDAMILAMKAPGVVEGNVVLVLLGLGVAERIPRTKNLYDWVRWGWNWEEL